MKYSNSYGDIIDRPGDKCVEVRWFDTTSAMNTEEFKEFLTRFVEFVDECKRDGVLIDAIQFKVNPSLMDAAWRDENIIPRYNAAGVKKFAFIMPEGMPAIGNEPVKEGPAKFPTAYFSSRSDALNWLTQ